MEIKFIKPTIDAVEYIATNMRKADVDEIWASHHKTPIESLMSGWNLPGYSMIVTANDKPCLMVGVAENDTLSGIGYPWLLGTDDVVKCRRYLMVKTPLVIDEMLNMYSKLINYVHVNNTVSIEWLKRMGFIFNEPAPYGIDGELFHKFYITRD